MNHPLRSPSRRDFISAGLISLASIPFVGQVVSPVEANDSITSDVMHHPHFPAKAKRVIFLFMLGGPSQFETFENKPRLRELDGQPMSDSFLAKMKFAQITEQRPSLLGSHVKFARYGESGAEFSELLPYTSRVADELAVVKTMKTDEIPHHPAEVLMHTGTRMFGRPSLGAWINYGLGSESPDLPGYIVLQSGMRARTKGSIYASGFLSAAYQGVPLRDGASPILNLTLPVDRTVEDQKEVIDAVQHLNSIRHRQTNDSGTLARNHSYRLAGRRACLD